MSSTRNLLTFKFHLQRIIKVHHALNSNQIILKRVNSKCYCQLTPISSNNSSLIVTSESKSELDSNAKVPFERLHVSSDIIDANTFTLTSEEESKIKKYDKTLETSILEHYEGDLSHLKAILPATQTLSRYANHSPSIQILVDLGVHLYKWENNDKIMNLIISIREEQLKKYILFFHKTVAISLENLGPMLSKCPFILEQNLELMKARVVYMKSKKFTDEAIAGIIARHPRWLEYKVEQIDERLGFFQQTFRLSGNEVRGLCEQLPKLITKKKDWLMEISFAVKEQMGFDEKEMKQMLLQCPRLWTQDVTEIVNTFNYLHQEMQIPHKYICQFPNVLTSRKFRIENRHSFLKALKRNQYEPTKEHFISLKSLVAGTDSEFCANVAHTTPETYNLFLKSL